MALYSGEIERHWPQIARRDMALSGLPTVFDGMRIAQLSDIHMDEYTEPFFLREVIGQVNRLRPDLVLLTGDFVSDGLGTKAYEVGAAWQCANILRELECRSIYAVLGNHDFAVDDKEVTAALTDNGITVLRNACLPIERSGSRFWLAGLDDPVEGEPKPDLAIPPSIRGRPGEPIVLMCHAPDYVDYLLRHPAGKAVGLMVSGHTHGGQVRFPLLGAVQLPELGKKYVEGLFQLGSLQLYVNRGIGTVGLPFRFNCPPEITLFTMRTGRLAPQG